MKTHVMAMNIFPFEKMHLVCGSILYHYFCILFVLMVTISSFALYTVVMCVDFLGRL